MSPSARRPELVVKTQPPEQDLDFTASFHGANFSTNQEQIEAARYWGYRHGGPNPVEPANVRPPPARMGHQ